MRKPTVKATQPNEQILVQDILNFVQGVIIEEQRAGRAIEDDYQAQLGAALDEDIPPLPFPEVPAQSVAKKPGRVSELAAQRRAAQSDKGELPGQIHIDEAIAAADKPSAASPSPAPSKPSKASVKLAKVWKKKKVRRCRERVAALVKVKRYLEEMLAE